jgi:diazepam-binding inhibitor (GABA receptor modulator, acyl-CoA-binding protein)
MDQEFSNAVKDALKLPRRPDNDTLLRLYALFKQATDGDVKGTKPGLLDLKGRKKFEAWTSVKGMSRQDAQKNYIALVKELHAKG